jgi:hypothetical protein
MRLVQFDAFQSPRPYFRHQIRLIGKWTLEYSKMSDDESRYILEELHSAGKDPKFTGELGPERQAVVDDI